MMIRITHRDLEIGFAIGEFLAVVEADIRNAHGDMVARPAVSERSLELYNHVIEAVVALGEAQDELDS